MARELSNPALPAAPPARSVALALGCGGVRGLAHVPFIEALEELGVRPAVVSGCSFGAIVGAAVCAGIPAARIRAHALASLGSPKRVAASLWGARARMRNGLFDLERLLPAFIPDGVPSTFEELGTPLYVTATDFREAVPAVMDSGPLVTALAASASMPAVFLPVRAGGRTLVDGGMSDPVPFMLLKDSACPVVAIDVGGLPSPRRDVPTSSEALYAGSQLLQRSLVDARRKLWEPGLLVRPAVGAYRALDFHRASEVVAVADSMKDAFKRDVSRLLGL